MFKVNDRNTRTRCEICSKLTIKIPERRVSIVNFEHVTAGWGIIISKELLRRPVYKNIYKKNKTRNISIMKKELKVTIKSKTNSLAYRFL